ICKSNGESRMFCFFVSGPLSVVSGSQAWFVRLVFAMDHGPPTTEASLEAAHSHAAHTSHAAHSHAAHAAHSSHAVVVMMVVVVVAFGLGLADDDRVGGHQQRSDADGVLQRPANDL